MDHAEVRERLDDALLTPGGLRALEADESAAGRQLADHLATCRACAREREALRETAVLLAAAAPDDLHAPPEARERVLAAVASTGVVRRQRARAPSWGRPQLSRLAAAAGIVLLAGGALLAIELGAQRDRNQQQSRELARVTAATDRLLRVPGAVRVTLVRPDGAEAGTLIHDPASHEIVVVAQGLARPAGDGHYGCYLERDGQRIQVGYMRLFGELAYWAGPMADPPDAGRSGDRFVVVADPDQAPALVGVFGSG